MQIIINILLLEIIFNPKEKKMSKGQITKKSEKKAPLKTKQEKRAAKRAKQEEKNKPGMLK